MSNGGKRIVFSSRERAIGNDFTRLQDMIAQARAVHIARSAGDVYDASLPGHTSQIITGGQTPMIADVFGGLFVRVDDPSSLFVDPGVVGIVRPDTVPGIDDDPYKVIYEPGLQTAGALTFLSNSSGSTRIDLVVAAISEQVLETDSRDVFDPSSGLFTPESVNKVAAKRLSYSIFRGTPGNGMPTITSVLPLLVASVPDGATSWADVTFWDVRPLWQERSTWFSAGITRYSNRTPYDFNFHQIGTIATGEAWTTYNGYLAGGKLKKSTPTATMGTGDVDFDFDDAENASNSLDIRGPLDGGTDQGAMPLFALFPNNLPRWARYSEGAAPGLSIRAPYGPRGILTAGRNTTTDKAKIDAKGIASGVAIPASTGLVGTSSGIMVYMAHNYLNAGGGAVALACRGNGRKVTFGTQASVAPGLARIESSQTATAQTQSIAWNLATLRDSNSYGIPRNMVELAVYWEPPALEVSGSLSPPHAQYNRLGMFMRHNSLLHMDFWGQDALLGDGTGDVPSPQLTGVFWCPIAYNPDSPAANVLTTGLASTDGSSGSDEPLPGAWQFQNLTTRLFLTGYCV